MLRFYQSLSQAQKTVITFALLLLALFLNLGMNPLALEEPRRTMVAFEMLLRNNFIVPTEFGQAYFNKPPVWNWIVIVGMKLFPNNLEMAGRFFSVIFFLLSGFVLFSALKKYANQKVALFSSLLYLISLDILFYFSLLGEIDLFYSSVTFSSFVLLFHFYNEKRYFVAFLLFYVCNAIGVLTKGMPSFLFAGITVLVLLLLNRDFKRIFSIQHIIGGIVFLAMVVGYFYVYSLQGDVEAFVDKLFFESASRTQAEKTGFFQIIAHIFAFPFETLKNIFPAAFLLPFVFVKGVKKQIQNNRLMVFFFWTIIANIIIYWVSEGTKQRYIYMLYPMLVSLIVFVYIENKDRLPKYKSILRVISIVLSVVFLAGSIAIPFLPMLKKFANMNMVSIVFSVVFLVLLALNFKQKQFDIWLMIWGFLLLRVVFNFTVIPYRSTFDEQAVMKNHALKIAEITGNEKVNLTKDSLTLCPRSLIFYLEKEKNQIVYKNNEPEKGAYCIADTALFRGVEFDIYYSFVENEEETYHLIKFTE